jgi:hypothetical protein
MDPQNTNLFGPEFDYYPSYGEESDFSYGSEINTDVNRLADAP